MTYAPLPVQPAQDGKCAVRDCQNHMHQGQFVGFVCLPCYITPPQRPWVGLTDEEWPSLGCKSVENVWIALAVQAKLKEKNS